MNISREINRITPNLPTRAYKTFQIASPRSTHFRSATCEEVQCPQAVHGWASVIDESTALGQKQAHYIRRLSGRRFTEEKTGGITRFVFAGNQECFADHQVRLERPEHYLVRSGDWRNLGRPRQHTRPEFWVEEFQENQGALSDLIERG